MTDRGRETERQIRQRYIQRERDTKRMKSTRIPCSSDGGIVAWCADSKREKDRERDTKRMKVPVYHVVVMVVQWHDVMKETERDIQRE